MDKETLSNYGWIVIAVLVISIMVALATPFGTYIANGVKSTTQGLFDTQQKAFNVLGLSDIADQEFEGGEAEIGEATIFIHREEYTVTSGNTLYDTIYDVIENQGRGFNDAHLDGEYSVTDMDDTFVYIENGRIQNLKNVKVKAGQTYKLNCFTFTKTISDKFYEIDAEGNIVTKEELTTKDVYEEISKLPTKVIYINTDDILENSKPLLPVLYLEGDTYQNIAEVLYPYWYRTIPTPALHMISYNVVADVTLAYPSGTRLLGTQSDHWFIALGDEATQTLRFLNNKPIANEILLGIKEVVSGTYTFEEAKQQVANSITAFLEMPYYDGHPVELGKLYQFENTTDTYDVVIYKDGSMAIFAPFLGNRGSYVTADKVKWSDSRIYITNNVGEIYYMDVLSNGNFEDNVTDVRGEFVKSESATLANELPEGTYVCESADVIIKFRSDDIELYEVNTHIGTISNDYVSIKDGLITINIEGELITLALHPNGKYIIVDDLFFKYQVLEN